MKFSFRYEFHFCFESELSNRVISFDIYFSFLHPEVYRSLEAKEHGGSRVEFPLLRAQSRFIISDEDWDLQPLFRVRHHPCGKVSFIRGRKRLRIPIVGSGSGGTWYWTIYHLPPARWAHAMNFLRRFRDRYSFDEWTDDFRALWDRPHTLRQKDLKRYARHTVREIVAEEKKKALAA